MSEESRRARAEALYGTNNPREIEQRHAELMVRYEASLRELKSRQIQREDEAVAVLQDLWAKLGIKTEIHRLPFEA